MESAFLKIINAKVLTPSGLLPNGQIIISDGKIVDITGQNREIPHAEIIDAKGYYVAPGCIDTHVHGGNGHDFTEATPKAFYAITRAHALQGNDGFISYIGSCLYRETFGKRSRPASTS